MIMASRHVPETRDPTATGRLDFRGAALAALALGGTTYALIEGSTGASGLVFAAGIGGVVALIAFLDAERRSTNPMMPLSIFSSRQFSAANLVTFAVYAALSGFFFLFVAFLQVSLGYSPIASGAASLPVTLLMLVLSARAGALAERIGPRIPLTVGPLVIAVGLLMMTRIEPGDAYVSSILPGVVVFGLGLTLVVAPVTATVLAAADERHSGIASGINNAVSRVAGLLAVAVLPLVAGLTGNKFYDPSVMVDGFHMAMVVSAGLAIVGGITAWRLISGDVLHTEPAPGGASPTEILNEPTCSSRERRCDPVARPRAIRSPSRPRRTESRVHPTRQHCRGAGRSFRRGVLDPRGRALDQALAARLVSRPGPVIRIENPRPQRPPTEEAR